MKQINVKACQTLEIIHPAVICLPRAKSSDKPLEKVLIKTHIISALGSLQCSWDVILNKAKPRLRFVYEWKQRGAKRACNRESVGQGQPRKCTPLRSEGQRELARPVSGEEQAGHWGGKEGWGKFPEQRGSITDEHCRRKSVGRVSQLDTLLVFLLRAWRAVMS